MFDDEPDDRSDDSNDLKLRGRKPLKFLNLIYILVVIGLLFLFFYGGYHSTKETTLNEFLQTMVASHDVQRIEIINNETVDVYIKPDKLSKPEYKDVATTMFNQPNPGPHYEFDIGSVEYFEQKLDETQKDVPQSEKIDVTYVKQSNWILNLLMWVLPIFLLFFLYRSLFRSSSVGGGGGGTSIFNFGRSTATLMEKENRSTVKFDDVAGLEEAKIEVKEIIDFLKDPQSYTRLGAKIPKGVIIVGPPGTGKTLLVKAVAGEADVPFFSISGSEFVEMFVGVGASRVRDLFRRAKEKAPCIIFIDEIDAVGRSRGRNAFYTGANDERESTLNQLLTEMDGFTTNSGVIVLAATNRGDMLDPALLRPGRFDRHIYLDLPTLIERKAIFKVHLRPILIDDSVDVDFLAGQTPGSSGADIANICNEAALIAARRKKATVSKQEFMDAIDRIVAGVEKKSKIISPDEKRIIAFHEAGHAVVSWLLKNVDPLVKVSIVPRGKSLGAAWYLPEERQLRNTAQFNDMLCAALGGRAAEEIIFGDVTSGALDDLEKVTKQAYTMIAYYGLDKKIGNISFYDSTGMTESAFQKPYSEETGKLIDEEVRRIIDEAYSRTKNILLVHRDELTKVADLLLQKEVVMKEDLEIILGKRETEHKSETVSSPKLAAMSNTFFE